MSPQLLTLSLCVHTVCDATSTPPPSQWGQRVVPCVCFRCWHCTDKEAFVYFFARRELTRLPWLKHCSCVHLGMYQAKGSFRGGWSGAFHLLTSARHFCTKLRTTSHSTKPKRERSAHVCAELACHVSALFLVLSHFEQPAQLSLIYAKFHKVSNISEEFMGHVMLLCASFSSFHICMMRSDSLPFTLHSCVAPFDQWTCA